MKRSLTLIVITLAFVSLPSCDWWTPIWTLGKYCKYPDIVSHIATVKYFAPKWSSDTMKCDVEKLYKMMSKELTIGLCDGSTYATPADQQKAFAGMAAAPVCKAALKFIGKHRGAKIEAKTGCDGAEVEKWYMKGEPVCVLAAAAIGALL
jgi:hypothetical protein